MKLFQRPFKKKFCADVLINSFASSHFWFFNIMGVSDSSASSIPPIASKII